MKTHHEGILKTLTLLFVWLSTPLIFAQNQNQVVRAKSAAPQQSSQQTVEPKSPAKAQSNPYDFIRVSNWDGNGDKRTDYCDELSSLNILSQKYGSFQNDPNRKTMNETEVRDAFLAISRGEKREFPCANQQDCLDRFGLAWERGVKSAVKELNQSQPWSDMTTGQAVRRYGMRMLRGDLNGVDTKAQMKRFLNEIEQGNKEGLPVMLALSEPGADVTKGASGHAVLATGIERKPDGSAVISIADPDEPGKTIQAVCAPGASTCEIDGKQKRVGIMPLQRDYALRLGIRAAQESGAPSSGNSASHAVPGARRSPSSAEVTR